MVKSRSRAAGGIGLGVDSMSLKTGKFVSAMSATIKRIREEKKITRSELAARSGLSAPFIGYIEEGQRCPTIDSLKRIAMALEVSATDLVAAAESSGEK